MATSIAVRHAPHASPSFAHRRAASRSSCVVSFSSGRSLAVRCRRQSQQSVSSRHPGPASRRSVRAAAAAAEGKDGEAQLSAEEAQDLSDIQDILETIELLKERRDMTVQEIRLVLMIEDPREAERRRQMGIENESGCSRDEIADAFLEVCEDRVPADRMVLRKLAQDMRDWPRLREEPGPEEAVGAGGQRTSPYAQITDVGLQGGAQANRTPAAYSASATSAGGGGSSASQWDAVVERVEKAAEKQAEEEKDLSSKVPSWVGYSVLYGISIIPIIIGVIVVVILFLNSLQ
ncbi:unnamed protein product [Closterium sp. NIES-65]|nr:unnamed protein product [Closterium sp. NIES-65]